MTDIDYHVIALVPGAAFDSDAAINALTENGYKPRMETNDNGVAGIRVIEDDGWSIVAWIEDDEEAREFVDSLRDDPPAGVPSDQIASCKVTLSIWSDNDPDLMNAHIFEEFIQSLKSSLGFYLFDNRLGEWR